MSQLIVLHGIRNTLFFVGILAMMAGLVLLLKQSIIWHRFNES